jgi:formate--tetrahydrofolate ligase
MALSLRPIADVAQELGLDPAHVLPWGRHRAKVDLAALNNRPETGRLILVSAINPTPPGEGKTTTSIALAMGLRLRGRRAVAALRQPSMGPVFGVKGGGTGGGRATFEPAQDINLHFTGDIHAVASAHNLLAALADNAAYYQDPINLNPQAITWPRTMDMNDRFLRNTIVGLGGRSHGTPRETRFDITAASEVISTS